MTGSTPDFGERPELAWLPIDVLDVDDRYQREIDTRAGRRIVARMVAGFSWRCFSPLIVTPGEIAGRYMILDGQHKAQAVREIGGIDAVPAMIVATDGLIEQAESFVALNTERVKIHQYALHRAEVAAGAPRALAIERVLTAAAVTVPAYPVPANQIKPRATLALKAVGWLIDTYDETRAAAALKLVADAYDDRPGNIRVSLLKAVCALQAARPDIPAATIAERVTSKLAVAWEFEAQTAAQANGVTTVVALQAALAGQPMSVPDAVPPALPAPAAAGRSGPKRLGAPVNRRCCSCGMGFRTDVIGLHQCEGCRA